MKLLTEQVFKLNFVPNFHVPVPRARNLMKSIGFDPFWALHVRTGNAKNHSRPIQGRLF